MSILTSEAEASTPAADAARTPRWSDARDQMIHACALQEHIIATAPVLPTDISVHIRTDLRDGYAFVTDEIDVRVYLHRNLAAIELYRAEFGGEVSELVHKTGSVCTTLRGSMFGCRFEVWTLVDPAVQR